MKKHRNAISIQHQTLKRLVQKAVSTQFGREHSFDQINSHSDFVRSVSAKDYEGLRSYFDAVKEGKVDVMWPGKPIYFAKTSGTTSGAKYIPITKESIYHHIVAARNALFCYVAETGKADFFDRKMIFLQGSPELNNVKGIPEGRLSGIVYHHVPKWLLANRKPGYEVNCIEDWEQKVEAIVAETITEDMSVVGGIPPWCIMYYEKLLSVAGKKTIKDIFPHFQLFVYGGVHYRPYRQKIDQLIGFPIDSIETYPASEGFFAYQDSQHQEGLLLNVDAGIFYEFIPIEDIDEDAPRRLSLGEIEIGKQYEIVVSTNAGLWSYRVGDTVKFVSIHPYRIIVTGRTKHFISAFGEHVIAEEVEYALSRACQELDVSVIEFTVAPKIQEDESCHEWLIEFDQVPQNIEQLAAKIDQYVCEKNIYYRDLRKGNVLQQLTITPVQKNGFTIYQQKIGKLGGQHKIQRLANNRKVADALSSCL